MYRMLLLGPENAMLLGCRGMLIVPTYCPALSKICTFGLIDSHPICGTDLAHLNAAKTRSWAPVRKRAIWLHIKRYEIVIDSVCND
jgi:hypothetical protein